MIETLDATEEDGHSHEWVSLCCGKPAHNDIDNMCGQCLDWTTFECDCGRERSETDD